MSTLRVKQGIVKLRLICSLILVILILSGCGFLGGASPETDEAAVIAPAAAPLEEAGGPVDDTVVISAGEMPVAEEPAAEEKVVLIEREEAAELEAEPELRAVVPEVEKAESVGYDAADESGAIAPMPTASPAPAVSEVSLEADRADSVAAVEVQQQYEPLRAGEVDDNAQWDDYLLYRRNYGGPNVHNRDISERYIIEVEDGQGHPILGATVSVFLPGQQGQEIYTAQTYANGQVLFHPLALAEEFPLAQIDRFIVEVQHDNLLEQFTLTRFDAQAATSFSERWTVSLDTQQEFDSLDLDVLFLIDATGSMADEIAKIQDTIFDVAAQIDALPGQPNVRYGMVTYRDRGDSYVTRNYEFTPNVDEFHHSLMTVVADGGGDTPESLNEALHEALHRVEWRGGETIQLIFLVADAPPHLDYAQDYDYAVEMETAARRGIKIFPIASSGLDDQGEYIFRQIAQFTQGRFIFLTYAGPTNGGAPGDATTHHVDDYSVENLDELLVKLVEEELAYQTPVLAQGQ